MTDTHIVGGTARQSHTWQVGDVTVTQFVDTVGTLDLTAIFAGATQADIQAIDWLVPDFATHEGIGIFSYHSLIVDTPVHRILVDTCWGNDKYLGPWDEYAGRHTTFLGDLAAAGFALSSVDIVVCTHLHADHIGFNTNLVDGNWVPSFPRARYVLNAAELEYWRTPSARGLDPGMVALQESAFRESVQPIIDAGVVELVDGVHDLGGGVVLEPTIGHTAGHMSVRIKSAGQEALITGDIAHHPSQIARPDWGISADHDSADAIETRRRVFTDAAERGILVIGTHWPGPTAGTIVCDGDALRLTPAATS